jgi:hypothetical protein
MVFLYDLPGIMCQTVTGQRRVQTGDNRYGNPVYESEEVDLPGCSFQPLDNTLETHDDQDQVTSRWKLYAPPSIDLTSLDYITVNGVLYEFDGQVMVWPGPTGIPHHAEAFLKLVEG